MLCEYNGKGCGHETGCTKHVDAKGFKCGIYPYMEFLDEFALKRQMERMSDKELNVAYVVVIRERNKRLMAACAKKMVK